MMGLIWLDEGFNQCLYVSLCIFMILHVLCFAQVRSKAGRPCGGGKGSSFQNRRSTGASRLAVGTFKPEVAKEAWKEQQSPNGAPPLKGSLADEDLCRVLGKYFYSFLMQSWSFEFRCAALSVQE